MFLPALPNQLCLEVSFHWVYRETGYLIHSVMPWLLQFSPFWPSCFLCLQPSVYSKLCCSTCPKKMRDWPHHTCFNPSTGFQPHKEFSTRQTLSAVNVSRALLRPTSFSVFNYTHPPVLSILLLIILAQDFSYQTFHCWFLYLFHLQPLDMEWPSPSSLTERPSLDSSKSSLKIFLFFQKKQPAMFLSLMYCIPPS